jgi:inward rectifier potassium channel
VKTKPVYVQTPGASYRIKVLGHRPTPLRDFYHALLRMRWGWMFAIITAIYLVVNLVFALGFLLVGGVAHAEPGSFLDAFFFSVQTLATIGYGTMYPESHAANALVALEALVGILLTALVTGLVFARFSRPQARVVFSRNAVLTPMNGVPTLMFRIGNERGNQIVNTEIRVVFVRTEQLQEGGHFYRSYELTLVRDRALSLSRSWNVLHAIDAKSPLHGATPELLEAQEAELQVMVLGTDDITLQGVHASHRYAASQVLWGSRLADILTEEPGGDMVLDLDHFHDTRPGTPTEAFPYPKAS